MLDIEIQELIQKEKRRQSETVSLIASENEYSDDVKEALSGCFGHKYAEGYPNARYYAGNSVCDELEVLCQKRALNLFELQEEKWSVNVQALSGSPANMAIFAGVLEKGDKIMGLALSHGGHLTHGFSVSQSGKLYQQIPYYVCEKTHELDYNNLLEIALAEKPKLIIAGFTAYPRKIDWQKFKEIADSCGALLLCDISHTAGLIAGKVMDSPFDYADIIMTTTHKTLRGPRGALIFTKKDERNLDKKIDKAVFPGSQGGPHMHTIAGIAVALKEAKTLEFRNYAQDIVKNADYLAKKLTQKGLKLITNGTDSHMILLDVWRDGLGISGSQAQDNLEKIGIITNKNTIPYDTRKPNDPSGLRLGTAWITSRNFSLEQIDELAQKIAEICIIK
jgi:glycine hydroxymethyltransferase